MLSTKSDGKLDHSLALKIVDEVHELKTQSKKFKPGSKELKNIEMMIDRLEKSVKEKTIM